MLRLPLAHSLVLGQLIRLWAPAVLTALIVLLAPAHVQAAIPTWLAVLVAALAIPTYHIGRSKLRTWHNMYKAARLGATMPVRWDGKMPGNVDLLQRVDKAYWNGYLGDPFAEIFNKLGHMYNFDVLWCDYYFTCDPSIIKTILSTDFPNWVKGEQYDMYMGSVLGGGIFNSDGERWKFHRSMTRPFFIRERITDFDTFDIHADVVIKKIRDRLRGGYAVDFQDIISRFTLDSATEFLFGSCVRSLDGTLPYPHDAPVQLKNIPSSPADAFAEAFRDCQVAIAHRSWLMWMWPWFELFGSRTSTQMNVVNDYLRPIVEKAIDRAKEYKTTDESGTQQSVEVNDKDTLLDHLARYTTDPVILHDEVLNIMIAGRDTTAAMLTMVIYFLSQHPEVLHRLRQEILDTVGPNSQPTYDDIRGMKYLRAVLNETMRLYPAVPLNIRYAVKDSILPSSDPSGKPWFVPAGTPVMYTVHAMQRKEEYWGPDAEDFNPDRFIDDRLHKYLTSNPFIFLPFNAGPRICLGQQFAYNQMSFFLVRLLQNFDSVALDLDALEPKFRPPTDWAAGPGRKSKEKFWPKSHLTLYAAGGLWVRMGEASSGTAVSSNEVV